MFFSNLKGLISTYTWASWTLNTCVSVGISSCQYLQVTSIHLYEKLLLNHTPHGKCEAIQTLRQNDLSKRNFESLQHWLQYVCRLCKCFIIWLASYTVITAKTYTIYMVLVLFATQMYSPANKIQNVHCPQHTQKAKRMTW